MKKIIFISSIIIIAVLIAEAYRENLGMDWHSYQTEYIKEIQSTASGENEKNLAETFKIKLRQIVIPESNRIDRCISCHIGFEDPKMAEMENPLKTHPGNILDNHEVEKFGCVICHGGQGRAVTIFQAHGEVAFWPYPIIKTVIGSDPEVSPEVTSSELLQSSCYQCHNSPDLFTIQKTGTDVLSDGLELFTNKGCLSCHQLYGIGANTGIDLSLIGDKPLSEYDFTHFPENEEKTIFNWHYQHLKNPKNVVPDSLMPLRTFSRSNLRSLSVLLMSFKKRGDNSLLKFSRAEMDGEKAFEVFCAGCHGTKGRGTDRATSLNNKVLQMKVSEQFLQNAIVNGRSGSRVMPSMVFENTGVFDEEIAAVIRYMRSWPMDGDVQESLDLDFTRIEGNVENGREVFHLKDSCSKCHGNKGSGVYNAPQLNNQDFLKIATDSYIKATVLSDRMKIPRMPSADELNDVIAYIRSWQK